MKRPKFDDLWRVSFHAITHLHCFSADNEGSGFSIEFEAKKKPAVCRGLFL